MRVLALFSLVGQGNSHLNSLGGEVVAKKSKRSG
jgi:hypothetical protein